MMLMPPNPPENFKTCLSKRSMVQAFAKLFSADCVLHSRVFCGRDFVLGTGFIVFVPPLAEISPLLGCFMTLEECEKLEDLCNRITEEQDPVTFDELVLALNKLLDHTQQTTLPLQ